MRTAGRGGQREPSSDDGIASVVSAASQGKGSFLTMVNADADRVELKHGAAGCDVAMAVKEI